MKIFVKLTNPSSSFTDPTQPSAVTKTIVGEKVFEVERTDLIRRAINFGALVEVKQPEKKAAPVAENPTAKTTKPTEVSTPESTTATGNPADAKKG